MSIGPASQTSDAPHQHFEARFKFPESPSLFGGKFQQSVNFRPLPKAHVDRRVAARPIRRNRVKTVGQWLKRNLISSGTSFSVCCRTTVPRSGFSRSIGANRRARKAGAFTEPDEAMKFLQRGEKKLKAEGWIEA